MLDTTSLDIELDETLARHNAGKSCSGAAQTAFQRRWAEPACYAIEQAQPRTCYCFDRLVSRNSDRICILLVLLVFLILPLYFNALERTTALGNIYNL